MASDLKIYLGLNGHANCESLPLRFGTRITMPIQQFCVLENAVFDEEGTNSQRPVEISRGNRHYLGDLVIPAADPAGEPARFSCRVVLGEPRTATQSPPVITILRLDNNAGDMTVTKHISGMLKRGRITPSDLIEVFHPAYLAGHIRDSNDCEEIFDRLRATRPVKIDAPSRIDELVLESADDIRQVVNDLPIDGIELMSRLTFEPLPLSDRVKYKYVMADAYIEDAWRDQDKIWVRVINTKGEIQDLHSFKVRDHLTIHHDHAFEYLKSRIHQRGYFAICMSPPCKGYLAESVTSIAMQLMTY